MTLKGFITIILVDLLLPVALIFNIYLYFYPLLYGCAFPRPSPDSAQAPFRLMTIADPQIEGDTALRRYGYVVRTPEELETQSLVNRINDQLENTARTIKYFGKTLDLWGNDRYLRHVYRTVKKLTNPTHVTVLGDLLGSQWISDEEFARRGKRFWHIFSDAQKVTAEDVAAGSADGEVWRAKLLTMAGNHDVGYAGDMNRPRIDRFEHMFGPVNYRLTWHPELNESLPQSSVPPELRIVVLNSLALDAPIAVHELAADAYDLINTVLQNNIPDASQATLLLTHIPLWKPAGVCVDGPMVTYFPTRYGGGIHSQNFISDQVSDNLKAWMFGLPTMSDDPKHRRKMRGVVLTGHDHEGCDVTHWWNPTPREPRNEEDGNARFGGWNVTRTKEWRAAGRDTGMKAAMEAKFGKSIEEVREATVKSMMGEYGGNIGLLSAWWLQETQEWRFEYSFCELGVQHIWWATHGINVGCVVWLLILSAVFIKDTIEIVGERKKKDQKKRKEAEEKKKN